jgi:hypothetical protein
LKECAAEIKSVEIENMPKFENKRAKMALDCSPDPLNSSKQLLKQAT